MRVPIYLGYLSTGHDKIRCLAGRLFGEPMKVTAVCRGNAEPLQSRCFAAMTWRSSMLRQPSPVDLPAQLFSACDDVLLVLRTEPLAYRTLPAFLHLLEEPRTLGLRSSLRGVLLTYRSAAEPAAEFTEEEIRSLLGPAVLPQIDSRSISKSGGRFCWVRQSSNCDALPHRERTYSDDLAVELGLIANSVPVSPKSIPPQPTFIIDAAAFAAADRCSRHRGRTGSH